MMAFRATHYFVLPHPSWDLASSSSISAEPSIPAPPDCLLLCRKTTSQPLLPTSQHPHNCQPRHQPGCQLAMGGVPPRSLFMHWILGHLLGQVLV